MPPTRRNLLQVASAVGLTGLSGCETTWDLGPSDDDGPRDAGDPPMGQSAAFVISKRGGRTVAVEGATGTVRFEADAPGRVFQRTFDALRGSGGRVFVRRGTYDVARQLDVDGPHTEIVSDYAHLRFTDHDHYTDEQQEQVDLNVREASIRVRGLIVDGNGENRSTPTRTLNVSSAPHVSVRDSIVRGGRSRGDGFRGYGINPYHASHLVVDNCLVMENDRHGIHPGSSRGSYQDVRITNNTFLDNASDPTGAAIDIRDHTRSAIISNNYFEGNGNGVRLKGGDLGWMQLSDNVFVDNYNDVHSSSAQVQVWTDGAADVAISDNSFSLSTAGSGKRDTVHVLANPNGAVPHTRIQGNRFAGGAFGVVAGGELEWAVVEGNHFSDNEKAAVNIHRAERGLVRRNTFDQPERRPGVVVEDVSNGVVTDNVLENAAVEVPDDVTEARNVEW